jgi:hypothetical protein
MSNQPIIQNVPTEPPPQTNIGILVQHGQSVPTTPKINGSYPDWSLSLQREVMVFKKEINTQTPLNTELFHIPPIGLRTDALFPDHVLPFGLNTYFNTSVKFTFWAMKAPQSVGRIRFVYKPPDSLSFAATKQRDISREWDLSLSNIFSMTIPGFHTKEWRNCSNSTEVYAPPGIATNILCADDRGFGKLTMQLIAKFQPGSIFPDVCPIYGFMSFPDAQFRSVRSLPITGDLAVYNKKI